MGGAITTIIITTTTMITTITITIITTTTITIITTTTIIAIITTIIITTTTMITTITTTTTKIGRAGPLTKSYFVVIQEELGQEDPDPLTHASVAHGSTQAFYLTKVPSALGLW